MLAISTKRPITTPASIFIPAAVSIEIASLAPLVSPFGLHSRAGCPEPSQAPVLPRSLPLVSPFGLHSRAGSPEPPQTSVLPRSSRDRS